MVRMTDGMATYISVNHDRSLVATFDIRTSSESRMHTALVSWAPPVNTQTPPSASPRATCGSQHPDLSLPQHWAVCFLAVA